MKAMTKQQAEKLSTDIATWEHERIAASTALTLAFGNPVDLLPQDKWYPSPLSMPEQISGDIRIVHRFVEGSTPVIGSRQAICRNIRPVQLRLEGPLLVTYLESKKDGTWMSDLPEELYQVAEMIEQVQPRGDVLVGGLGLGVLAHRLAALEPVRSITIIERDRDVIRMVEPFLPAGVKVEQADIKGYLKASHRRFDTYLLDTWQSTSETTWWEKVMPLKRIIRNRFGAAPEIHCWAEDIMAGQVLHKLVSPRRDWYYAKLKPSMTPIEAATFLVSVGTKQWERKYKSKLSKELT